jgi:hypothetical protein
MRRFFHFLPLKICNRSSSEDETQMSNQDKQNDTHAGQTLSSISTSFKNKFTRERANSKDCTIS